MARSDMRLFIGMAMPFDVQDRLSMLSGGIPGARWVAPENLHLTLRFLGDTTPRQAEDLIDALSRLETRPIRIAISGLGLFGDRRRQQQLYADILPDPALTALNRKIEQVAQRAGFPPEGRRFHPHVTIARMRNPDRGRLDRYLMANACLTLPAFEAEGFTLFRSHLGSDGAQYEPLVEFGGEMLVEEV